MNALALDIEFRGGPWDGGYLLAVERESLPNFVWVPARTNNPAPWLMGVNFAPGMNPYPYRLCSMAGRAIYQWSMILTPSNRKST